MGRRIRTMYATDHKEFSQGTVNSSPTMCLQHLQEHTNIKAILQKYEERDSSPLELADISAYSTYDKNYSYQDLRDHMLMIEEDFLKLPSSVRATFGHNPGKFYEYMLNPENLADGIAKGYFIDTREPEAPKKTYEELLAERKEKIKQEMFEKSLDEQARMGLGIVGGKG